MKDDCANVLHGRVVVSSENPARFVELMTEGLEYLESARNQ
jgi:hypothetical protein